MDGLSSTLPPPTANRDTKTKKEGKLPDEQQQPRARKTPAAITISHPSTAESKKGAPIASASKAKPSANMKAPAVVQAQPKKTPPVIVSSSATEEEKKMEATKRKLHERYQEAEEAKRQRKIQWIEPPRPPPEMKKGQMQRNAHPARCAAARGFVKPSSLGMRV